jgi:hypothetical protein
MQFAHRQSLSNAVDGARGSGSCEVPREIQYLALLTPEIRSTSRHGLAIRIDASNPPSAIQPAIPIAQPAHYATKEAAFEAAVIAAQRAICESHPVALMSGSPEKSADAQNFHLGGALLDQWRNGIRKNASRS